MAAHHGYRRFSGHAGASGAFGEGHGDGLAGEGGFDVAGEGVGFRGDFVGGRIADEGGEFLGSEVGD